MLSRIILILTSLLLVRCIHAQGQSKKADGFFSRYLITLIASGGFSVRNIDNAKTFFSSTRTGAAELNFKGYKTSLQVSLTMPDDEFFFNKLSTGIRADYFKLKEKTAPENTEHLSLFYLGLVEGGLFPLTPGSKVSFKLDFTIGFAQYKNTRQVSTQFYEVRGQGLGYGIAPFVSAEVARNFYLNLGADILTATINSKVRSTPEAVNDRASEVTTLISGVISITKIF